MRVCVMVALVMVGLQLQMPWWYWLVIGIDAAIILAKVTYAVGKGK